MPLTLILRAESAPSHAPSPALTFDGPRVVIGRGAGCDVRLPDPSVSHRHATVRATGSEWSLVDEGSTNGTFVGGERLAARAARPIKSGEMVRVGRVWLEVRIDQSPATRDLAFATRDLALALVSQAMRALGEDVASRVRVVDGADAGAGFALEDEGRAYSIGRDATCDLPLSDGDASRTHALVTRRGATVLVRDLGSKNGAWLGDQRLPAERDVPWRTGAHLKIGATSIALEEPAADALAELEAAADEPIAPEDVPPEPAPSDPRVQSMRATGDAPAPAGATPAVSNTPPGAAAKGAPAGAARSGWNATDLAVVLAALAVMGLSLAGLWWLLRS